MVLRASPLACMGEQMLTWRAGVPGAHARLHARQVCFALCQLAAGFKVNAPTSLLSPYFKDIVQALLETVCYTSPYCMLCCTAKHGSSVIVQPVFVWYDTEHA